MPSAPAQSFARGYVVLSLATLLAGCSANDDAARLAAVQAALDRSPPTLTVPSGRFCFKQFTDVQQNPERYRKFTFVRIKPAGTAYSPFGPAKCMDVVWDKSAELTPKEEEEGDQSVAELKLGRMIVDKVGVDQTGSFGVKMAPYRTHFEPNAIGAALIAANIASTPTVSDTAATSLQKDADGKWIAR